MGSVSFETCLFPYRVWVVGGHKILVRETGGTRNLEGGRDKRSDWVRMRDMKF